MEYSAICSSNLCRLRSASFRTNEQFLPTLTELIDCASTWRKRIANPICNQTVNSRFASTFARLRQLDRCFLRAEKNAMLREYIGRFLEGQLIPALRIGLSIVRKREKSERFPLRFPSLQIHLSDTLCVYSSSYTSKYFHVDLDTLSALFEAGRESAYDIIASVVVLSVVYQYLLGHVHRGGTKTYNPGSIEFRATFISLLLFRGAYVWIKFRDVAARAARTVSRRRKKDKFRKVLKDEFGQVQYYDKYEPRFVPPREEGTPKKSYLPLGGYDTHKDAELVCQIARFYYGKDERVVTLEDGSHFSIPVMSEQERSLCGEQKREWVSAKAKEVFKEIQEKNKESRENASRRLPSEDQVGARGCSSSADQSAIAPLAPASIDGIDRFLAPAFSDEIDAFLEGLPTLAEKHGPLVSVDEGTHLDLNLETFDVPMPSMQERLSEELHLRERQLAAEYDRRLVEEHQKYRRLEEENSELRQENKRLKTLLQQAANPLRAFFLTSTVQLESSTENC